MTTPHDSRPLAQRVLSRLLDGEELDPGLFSATFINDAGYDRLTRAVTSTRAQLGKDIVVHAIDEATADLRGKGMVVRVQFAVDSRERLTSLWLGPIRSESPRLSTSVAALLELSGSIGLLVREDGADLAQTAAATPMPVASAFKLAVLAALRDRVQGAPESWEKVLRLREDDRSLPTGILQDWPVGSALTVHALAALTMQVSDNTATDMLIRWMGRDAVERHTDHSIPLLTTRESFLLQDPRNREIRDQYMDSNVEERRSLLTDIAGLPLASSAEAVLHSARDDTHDEAGFHAWWFTPRELCFLMEAVLDLDIATVQAGVPEPERWARAASKGGREPGVLSFVSGLVGKRNHQFSVAFVQNGEVDEGKTAGLYADLVQALAERDAQDAPR